MLISARELVQDDGQLTLTVVLYIVHHLWLWHGIMMGSRRSCLDCRVMMC